MTPPSKSPPLSFSSLLETAHTLADLSGAVILRHFRRPIPVDDKGGAAGFDPVTAADRDAERVISRHLLRHHPGHAIVGEEHGGRRSGWFRIPPGRG